MQYVLVHGSWQGGWCWKYVEAELRQRGHKVSCPDLPGHGSNPFPLPDVSYDAYYQYLTKELHKYDDQVVLVAHSMSGILAAPLLDQYPDRISHLFLIAAFVAQNGQSLLDVALAGGPSEIPQLLITNEKENTQSLDPHKVRNALYHDCPSELAEWALHQLQPQPLGPLTTPIYWQDSNIARHKRTYILCEEDRDVHVSTQRTIIDSYPCQVNPIQSGHFPFLSRPKKLAEMLTHPSHNSKEFFG